MEEISISEFRATCLAVLRRVEKTGKPVLVTRYGKPLAEIISAHKYRRPVSWVGSMAGTGRILGDIVAPVNAEDDWEALR